jgi:ankyrin repeat protein
MDELRIGVDAKDSHRTSSLARAVFEGDKNLAEQLLVSGTCVNSMNKYARVLLHRAASWWHTDLVRFLLKCEASVDFPDLYGNTPLICAVRRRRIPYNKDYNVPLENSKKGITVVLLLLFGAKPYRKNLRGFSAVDYAVRLQEEDLVALLTLYSK